MYNNQLRILVCVADCGSFAKAAEKLFLSPTEIMKQINALEEHLELKLLKRTPRGVFNQSRTVHLSGLPAPF